MAGGSPAPTDTTDTTSHINTQYDSDEDGVVEKADDADTLAGMTPSEVTPASTQQTSISGGYTSGFTKEKNNIYNDSGQLAITATVDWPGAVDGIEFDLTMQVVSGYTFERKFSEFQVRTGETWTTVATPNDSPKSTDGVAETTPYTFNFDATHVDEIKFVHDQVRSNTNQGTIRLENIRSHMATVPAHSHDI